MRAPRFLAIDFYCGAGGTTRGLLDVGGYVIAGIDKDERCRETYQHNNRNTTLDCYEPNFMALDMLPASDEHPGGQQDEVWNALKREIPRYRKKAPGIPLMFAICAPCQSFTKFVQRRMTTDRVEGRERDKSLLAQTIEFIEHFKPEMVLSENVAGIGRGQYRQIWEDFQADLRALGYVVGQRGVCASRFGIAQYRRRSILGAVKLKQVSDLHSELSVPERDTELEETVSVKEAIGNFPPLEAGGKGISIPNHVCRNLTEINRYRLMSVEPGEPNFNFENSRYGDLSLACHRRLTEKGTRGFGDVYTRMHPDRPSPTITTRFHSISNGRFGHYDKAQVRGMSLREGAALQSFSDDYEFYGEGMDTIATMIGNAVPPKLSAYMAGWLYEVWADNKENISE